MIRSFQCMLLLLCLSVPGDAQACTVEGRSPSSSQAAAAIEDAIMSFDQEKAEEADLENDDPSLLQKKVGTEVSPLAGGDDDGADYDADTETDGVNSAIGGLLQDKVPLVEETDSDLVTAKQSGKEDAPVDANTKTTLFKIRRLINGSSLNRAFKDHEAGVAVLSKHREGVVKCARHLSSSSLVKSKAAINSLMPLAKGCQTALQGKDMTTQPPRPLSVSSAF